MENQETTTYVINMLKEIHHTTTVLSQNHSILFKEFKLLNEKVDRLDQKVDDNYSKLNQKIDNNYAKLDKKIDDNSAKLDKNRQTIFRVQNTLCHIEKEIKDLRTDIDTVYDLENDSRKKLKHLF